MIAEEDRLLAERKRASTLADVEVGGFFVVGSIVTLLLLIWSYRIVQRYAAERDRAALQVALATANCKKKSPAPTS
jgi:hypothetical protein